MKMKEAGLWCTRPSLLLHERSGRLTVARTPNGRRKFTEQHIKEIIEAFSPGGVGEWHYTGDHQYVAAIWN